jgi:hypothetical protein
MRASPITYLYLDDEAPDAVGPFRETVERRTEGLRINHGLILDLRLDQHPNWQERGEGDRGAERANYRASTLAQEIRTRAAEDRRGEYPIVLWSTDRKLSDSYDRDDTSHDLFDLKSVKQSLRDPQKAEETGQQLRALVEGYRMISEIRDVVENRAGQFHRFLGLPEPPGFLDERLLERFERPRLIRPAHEYARFILRHLLETPGPLIDKATLTARLGLSQGESPDADDLISTRFEQASYQGPFASGWPRWWESRVIDVWNELTGGGRPLRSLPASERVAALKEQTGLTRITAATPIEAGYSTRYWTVCQVTSRPLDPRDGFRLYRTRLHPWQEDLYVSVEAARPQVGRPRITVKDIDPADRNRFEQARPMGTAAGDR